MAVTTIGQLLESGAHFGHQTNRWNPKMKRYIFGSRNGIYIIDLQQTLSKFREAYEFIRNTTARGDKVLFVGTKKQAQPSPTPDRAKRWSKSKPSASAPATSSAITARRCTGATGPSP